MQFRMVPHQTKKGKHESNTSDVLRRKLSAQLLSRHRIGTKRKERQDQRQRQHATTSAAANYCAYCRMRFTPFIVALLAEEFVFARPPGFNRAFIMRHLVPTSGTAECRRRFLGKD